MGTGIVPIVLHDQFLQFAGLDTIVNILFGLNTFIFLFFSVITILRYVIWPSKFKEVIMHPVDCMFLGAFPMGLSTLINLTALIIIPNTGKRYITALWVVWWIDAALSALSIVVVSFLMYVSCLTSPLLALLTTRRMFTHPAELNGVTAAWVLPIVPGIVSAAAGANVAAVLQDDSRAITTILACYVLIGLSFPTGFMVATVYFSRLVLYKLPPRESAPSTFLPLGLSAQTSLG